MKEGKGQLKGKQPLAPEVAASLQGERVVALATERGGRVRAGWCREGWRGREGGEAARPRPRPWLSGQSRWQGPGCGARCEARG